MVKNRKRGEEGNKNLNIFRTKKNRSNKKVFFIKWQTRSKEIWHCVKYERIQVFANLYFPVWGQYRRFCPCNGKYGSVKTHIVTYFTQHWLMSFPLVSLILVSVCIIKRKVRNAFAMHNMKNTVGFALTQLTFTCSK